jgi:hypothetical protein
MDWTERTRLRKILQLIVTGHGKTGVKEADTASAKDMNRLSPSDHPPHITQLK